jgi:hypothetical protein
LIVKDLFVVIYEKLGNRQTLVGNPGW